MATTFYREDTGEIAAVAQRVITKHFADVQEVDTTFKFLFADAIKDDKTGEKPAALKLGGYPCEAIIKIVPYKDRVAGMPDVVIYVDAEAWDDKTDKEREALMHHECNHLQLLRAEDGTPRVDDAGRPKFRMRKHDFQHGWFAATAKLYGTHSGEVKQYAAVTTWMQKEIAFG